VAAAPLRARVVAPPPFVHGWERGLRADPDAAVKFELRLTPQNVHVLRQVAEAVSDPKSSQYTQYLTAEEVNRLVAPSEAHVAAVVGWLSAHNVRPLALSVPTRTKRWHIHVSALADRRSCSSTRGRAPSSSGPRSPTPSAFLTPSSTR
jgi:hypothetical protein